MPMHTRGQKMAQEAFRRVQANGEKSKDYRAFARSFPSLLHQCGLAQAVAFALADKKKPHRLRYVADLEAVLGKNELEERTRDARVEEYIRLSRDGLDAASWLKRYVEALFGTDDEEGGR